MKKPRAVVVGASHWHAPLYLDALPRHFEFSAADRVRDALSASPDVVFVLSTQARMAAEALEVVAAGIPLVLEKPGGLGLDQLKEVRDATSASGVPAAVPFVHRWAPFASVARSVGTPLHLDVSYLAGPPQRYIEASCDWMLEPRDGGGALVNLGPHFVDLTTFLMDSPIAHVRAVTHRRRHGLAIDDHAVVMLETADGRSATITVGYCFPSARAQRHVTVGVVGTDGHVSVGPDGNVIATHSDGRRTEWHVDVGSDVLFGQFVGRIADSLDSGFEGLPGPADLFSAMRVIRDAYRVAEPDGRWEQAWSM